MQVNDKYFEQYELDYFELRKKYGKYKMDLIVEKELEKLHPDFNEGTKYFTKRILINKKIRLLIFVLNNNSCLSEKINFVVDKKYGMKFYLKNEKNIFLVVGIMFFVLFVSFIIFSNYNIDNNVVENICDDDLINVNVKNNIETSDLVSLIFDVVEKQKEIGVKKFEYDCKDNLEIIKIAFENLNLRKFIEEIKNILNDFNIEYYVDEVSYINNIPKFEIEFKRKITRENINYVNNFIDDEIKNTIVQNYGYLKSEEMNYLSFNIQKKYLKSLFESDKWNNYKIGNIYMDFTNELCNVQFNLKDKSTNYGLLKNDLSLIVKKVKVYKDNVAYENIKESVGKNMKENNIIGKIKIDGTVVECIKDENGKIIVKGSEYENK